MDRIDRNFVELTANDLDRCAADIDELAGRVRFRRKLRDAMENRAFRVRDLAERLRNLTAGDPE